MAILKPSPPHTTSTDFWSFTFAKLATIWSFQLGLAYLVLRSDMQPILIIPPNRHWPTVERMKTGNTLTIMILTALDIFFFLLRPYGILILRFTPAFYLLSCILKNIVILVPIVHLVFVLIDEGRGDPGQGWLLMYACLLEGYFLAPTVYAYMVWATDRWAYRYGRLANEDRNP